MSANKLMGKGLAQSRPDDITFNVGREIGAKQPKVRFIKIGDTSYKALVYGVCGTHIKHDAGAHPTAEAAATLYSLLAEDQDNKVAHFMGWGQG